MLLFGIDLETGGDFALPKEENFIVEIGYVVWDTDLNAPVKMANDIVDLGKPMHPKAIEYNGINDSLVKNFGVSGKKLTYFWNELVDWATACEFLVAHNGVVFDFPIIELFSKENLLAPLPEKLILDTMSDVDYPGNAMSRNLTYLAGFHKILNFFQHRAVTDVLTMFEIMSKYNMDEIIKNAMRPTITVQALVTYDDREKPKKFKFQWKPENKTWVKNMSDKDFFKDLNDFDFPIKILDVKFRRTVEPKTLVIPYDQHNKVSWTREANVISEGVQFV